VAPTGSITSSTAIIALSAFSSYTSVSGTVSKSSSKSLSACVQRGGYLTCCSLESTSFHPRLSPGRTGRDCLNSGPKVIHRDDEQKKKKASDLS